MKHSAITHLALVLRVSDQGQPAIEVAIRPEILAQILARTEVWLLLHPTISLKIPWKLIKTFDG